MRTRLSRSVGLVEPAAKSAAKPGKTVAHFGPSRSTKTRHLNSRAPSGSSWSTSEQGFDRLQNGEPHSAGSPIATPRDPERRFLRVKLDIHASRNRRPFGIETSAILRAERALFRSPALEPLAELQAKLGDWRVLASPPSCSRCGLACVVKAHRDTLVAEQDLQILNPGTVGLEVFVSESMTQAMRSESCPFQPGSSSDPFNELTCTVDS